MRCWRRAIWLSADVYRRQTECRVVANNGLPGHVVGTSALSPTADIRAPMSVSDRGPEVNFCWKFSEPIMDRGCHSRLFLRGVARRVVITGSRHRAIVRARMGGACHGWGKRNAPPKRGFQPLCLLSCELGLLYPQLRTFPWPWLTSGFDPKETCGR